MITLIDSDGDLHINTLQVSPEDGKIGAKTEFSFVLAKKVGETDREALFRVGRQIVEKFGKILTEKTL